MPERKQELLQEDSSIRVEDLEKKVKLLDGYIHRAEAFIKSTNKKIERMKEKQLKELSAAAVRGGL
jgi:predicted  nucleic acid-binding Zn-ribbon protein